MDYGCCWLAGWDIVTGVLFTRTLAIKYLYGGEVPLTAATMRHILFGGNVVEIDPERSTIALRPTYTNLFVALTIGCLFAAVGFGLVYGVFYGEPGIPRKDWTTMNWWAFMALYSFVLMLGLFIGLCGAISILGTIWDCTTSRRTQVLDRSEGRCRVGNKTLFELDRVVSVGVEYEYVDGGESFRHGIRILQKDGLSHDWWAFFPVSLQKCSEVAREVASFLGVPLVGEENSTDKPPAIP